MSIQKNVPEFGKIRAAIWPIHTYELKKFLPMGAMMFFILFNYTILRDTKDSLVITASDGGSAVIPFLKLGLVLPASLLFVIIFTKLANIMEREKLFYTIVSFFILYFILFATVLYPNKELLHPSQESIKALQNTYPHFRHVFPVLGSWTYSIFYVMAELWGAVMISLLFWQFANEITRTSEAARFYGLFGLLGNVSLICSGFTIRYFSNIRQSLPPEVDAWGVSLNSMMAAVAASGVIIMLIYRWMNVSVLTDPRYYDQSATIGSAKQEKPKLSLKESFKYILSSKYLALIATIIIGYGISINLVEIVWKGLVKELYSNPNDYNTFMGTFSLTTGIATIVTIMLFKGVIRKSGWLAAAIMTPAVLMVTGAIFYAFVLFENKMEPWLSILGVSALYVAVITGAIQNILSKATKYSLFDPTKEMAYIPLDQELKVKGKAAVDVLGNRFGKASGGLISGFILIITAASSAIAIAPILAFIVLAVILAWMYAVKHLNVLYHQALQAKDSKDMVSTETSPEKTESPVGEEAAV